MRSITVLFGILWVLGACSYLTAEAPKAEAVPQGSLFVDAAGQPINESLVPEDLRNAAKRVVTDPKYGFHKGSNNAPLPQAALVLARVVFPIPDKDESFSSSLMATGATGGMHYMSANAADTKNVVCIRLLNFGGPCNLEVAKLGYQTAKMKVPVAATQEKIIWLGEVKLERSTGVTKTLSGLVNDIHGQPLAIDGSVSLRVNGSTPAMKSPLKNGRFSFPAVTPGAYLVEFWIDGYSVKTWWAKVPEDVETTTIAYPRFKLTLQPCGQGAGPAETLECGVAYKDATLNLDLQAKTIHAARQSGSSYLRVDQSGPRFDLYSPTLKLAVIDGPFVDAASALEAARKQPGTWYSWNGPLTPGQLLVLIDDHTPAGGKPGLSANAAFALALEVKNIVNAVKPDVAATQATTRPAPK